MPSEYRYYIEVLLIVIASITAISSVDDIFVDLYYWCLKLFGRQDAKDEALAQSISEAANLPERPFAIMVPAWHEHDVIYSMLATNSRLVTYKNYHFFVGVYQNDKATISEVRRAQAENANVHIVVVPRDGPTSKADCLNEILAAIRGYEIELGAHFAGIALHDAEDFIHPHELAVFNSLIGTRFDFVQLPVFSFNQSLRDLIGGIYMDEFAEVHTKDLIVRRHLSGLIPCAGVSACFSRDAVIALAEKNKGEVFQISSFTEDYDIAFRLRALGLRTTFVSCPVNYTIDIHRETITPVYVKRRLPIATREFFPSKMSGAYRQRARWLIGIVFQGTSSHGWKGKLGNEVFPAARPEGNFHRPYDHSWLLRVGESGFDPTVSGGTRERRSIRLPAVAARLRPRLIVCESDFSRLARFAPDVFHDQDLRLAPRPDVGAPPDRGEFRELLCLRPCHPHLPRPPNDRQAAGLGQDRPFVSDLVPARSEADARKHGVIGNMALDPNL